MQESFYSPANYLAVHQFNLHDALAVLVVGVAVYFVGHVIKNKHLKDLNYQKYFMPGLMVKMFGGLAYALVYTYYYNYGGDTSGFWHHGKRLFLILIDHPQYWYDAFNRNFNTSHSFVYDFLSRMIFAQDWEEYRMVQVTSLLAPFGLVNFFGTSMLLAALCYSGVWRLFLVFRDYFPAVHKHLAVSVLFIPSVVFWGSGIMKDTVVFASVGWIVYGVHQLMLRGWKQPRQFFWIALGVFLAGTMKAYVLFSLAPGLLIWRLLRYREAIRNRFLRYLALPFFLIGAVVGGLATVQFVGRYNPQYALENFIGGAQSMQGWHYQEGANTSEQYGRGSSYTLGEYEPNLGGVLSKVPAGINVTLFRPYIWETGTVMQLFSALESLTILLLTLFVLLRLGPAGVLKYINNNAFLLMMLSFSLIFAFGVGFSAYNFGALARYKVPCIPFFVAALFVLKHLSEKKKSASPDRSSSRAPSEAYR